MIVALRTSQGEVAAFVPDLNSNVTAGVEASDAVASRPDHPPKSGPAGEHHPCQREL